MVHTERLCRCACRVNKMLSLRYLATWTQNMEENVREKNRLFPSLPRVFLSYQSVTFRNKIFSSGDVISILRTNVRSPNGHAASTLIHPELFGNIGGYRFSQMTGYFDVAVQC